MSGTPKLTRLLPPNAMRRPPKENSTQATCVRLTTLFSRAPKADCPTQAPSAERPFFQSKQISGGGSFQLGPQTCFFSVSNRMFWQFSNMEKTKVVFEKISMVSIGTMKSYYTCDYFLENVLELSSFFVLETDHRLSMQANRLSFWCQKKNLENRFIVNVVAFRQQFFRSLAAPASWCI